MRPSIAIAGAATLIAALTACAGTSTGASSSAPAPASSSAPAPASSSAPAPASSSAPAPASSTPSAGRLISLADYRADPTAAHAAGAVVLFFDAAWCGSCQATVRSLESEGVPAGLTVVRVDYDGETDLKRQYGVRVQHTFVQVDAQGAPLGMWTGSPNGQAIVDEVV